MRINRQQKNLCIILFTFILLFGICFDSIQTDSFLSCSTFVTANESSEQSSPTLESSHNTSFLNQLCSEVLLGRQTSAAMQEQMLRRSFHARNSKGHSFAYLLTYILPLLFSSILMSVAYAFMPDIRKASIIIRYIQHKDGKKPQLSFSLMS